RLPARDAASLCQPDNIVPRHRQRSRSPVLLAWWRKLPSVTDLLSGTLEYRPERFPNLLVEMVRRGIRYRGGKGNPITRDEMEGLNEILQAVGFKISELWNREFLKSLPGQAIQEAPK